MKRPQSATVLHGWAVGSTIREVNAVKTWVYDSLAVNRQIIVDQAGQIGMVARFLDSDTRSIGWWNWKIHTYHS